MSHPTAIGSSPTLKNQKPKDSFQHIVMDPSSIWYKKNIHKRAIGCCFCVAEIVSVAIHSGGVGVNGPAVINLTQAINVDAFDSNGFAFGVLVLTSDVAFKFINNPAALYVQISTTNATLRENLVGEGGGR